MKNALLFFHFLAIVWGQSCDVNVCNSQYTTCLNDGGDMGLDHICQCYGSLGSCYSSQNCFTSEDYQQFIETCTSYGCPIEQCQASNQQTGYETGSDPCSVAQVSCGASYDQCVSQGTDQCTCSNNYQRCMLDNQCQIDLMYQDCNTPNPPPPTSATTTAHIHVGGFFLLAGLITLCCCTLCVCCRACRKKCRQRCASKSSQTPVDAKTTTTQQYAYIPLQNFQPQQTIPMFPVYGAQGGQFPQQPHPVYYPMFVPQPPQQQPKPIAPPQEKQ